MNQQLSQERLEKALYLFKEYSKEARFQEDSKERMERKKFFQHLIKEKFNELNFSEMIKKLWAAQIWGNKEYLINKIIKDNGIEKLENKFSRIFSKEGLPGKRYEELLGDVKGIGPSMITEILCYIDPDNAGIWNDKARKALAWLEVKNIPFDKYRITAEEYDKFNSILKLLAEQLNKEGYKDVDLLFVDYFLWEIWEKFSRQEPEVRQPPRVQTRALSKHDELCDKIAEIGSWLGFEVESEKLIATGAKIDVIWRAKIANLGAVSYAFEVQDRGSIDSLIVNLQRAQINPTVQKLIVISDEEQISKIKEEIKTMPESFRKACIFWESLDVDKTHLSLEQVSSSITKLGLVNE